MVPRLNPEQLPDNGAQVAHNVDVSSGVLAPLNVPGSFIRLHNESTEKLVSTVPEGDVVSITKPDAPTVLLTGKQCLPQYWLRIWAHDWISWINASGARVTNHVRSGPISILDVTYTETGLQVTTYLSPLTYYFTRGGPYFLTGPRFQFELIADAGEHGGPDTNAAHPFIASEFDPQFPPQQVPLVDTNSNIYGFFEVTDIYGPKYDEEILVTDYDLVWYTMPGFSTAYVTFIINLNYVVNKRRHVFYAQSAVNDADQEGPPSEISERITLKPGDLLSLSTPRPSGYSKNKLYRSATGGDDFLLVDDINADEFTDLNPQLKVDTIEPFGNLPSGVSAEDFLEGSFIHPAQFGAAFYDKTLYLSDPYNFHRWPDENTTPFVDAVDAHTLTGNTIVVFSGDLVFGVSGSNPAKMSKFVISNTTPLLNKLGLCRIGQTVYFPSDDGLIAISGTQVKNVTAAHFTRQQWQFLSPQNMKASVADGTIFLQATIETGPANDDDWYLTSFSRLTPFGVTNPVMESTTVNIRIDLDEEISAVTSYDQVTNTSFQWLSKRMYFDQEIIIDYVRITADAYPVTIELFVDRVSLGTLSVTSDLPIAVPGAVHGHELEFQITSSEIVRQVHLFDRAVISIQDSVRLTPENVDLWQNVRLKFPDFNKFSAGILSAQTDAAIPFVFYADDVEADTQQVEGGRVFTFPRAMIEGTHWRVAAETDKHIDELVLMRRTAQSVSGVLREVHSGGVAPWLIKRYEFVDRDDIRSIIVKSAQNMTMNIYYDGAVTPTETLTIENGQAVRVSNGQMSSLEFDFDGFDYLVDEVIVYTVGSARPITVDGGIRLTGDGSLRRMLFEFPDRGVFVCGSLGAASYGDDGIDIALYADGSLVHTETVTDGTVFKLPRSLAEGKLWEIDIDTSEDIYSLNLIPRRPAQAKDGVVRILNPEIIPPWCFTRYEFPEDTYLVSAMVNAESSVELRLYADGAEDPTEIITMTPGEETLLNDMAALRSIEFDFHDTEDDFAGEDHKVQEISLFGRVTKTVGNNGILEERRPNWRKLRYKFAEKSTFALAVLDVDNYTDVTMKLTADGVEQYSSTISGENPIDLPRGMGTGVVWEVDVDTPAKVESLVLLPKQVEVVGSGVVRAVNDSRLAPWRFTRYEFPDRKRIQSVIVHADSYPVNMVIYPNDEDNPSLTVSITSAAEARVAIPTLHEAVEFNFDGSDDLVRDVTVFAHDDRIVGENGITLENAPSYRGLRFKFEGGAGAFMSGSIGASEYDLGSLATLKLYLYADGVLKETVTVTDGKPFKLSRSNGEAEVWEVDVEHTGEVHSLFLYTRVQVPAQEQIREISSDGVRTQPWLKKRYEFADTTELRSLIVKSSDYPVKFRGYVDGDTSSTFTERLSNAREEVIGTGTQTADRLEFDFDDDDSVSEVMIFPEEIVPVSGTGLVFRGAGQFQPWRNKTLRFPDTGSWSVGRIVASDYTGMHLRLMIGGTAYTSKIISSSDEFKFPMSMRAGRDWQMDLRHQGRIHEVILIQRQPIELANGRVTIRKQEDPFTWLQKHVISRTPVAFSCARIASDRYPITFRMYHDGDLKGTVTVTNERAFRLPSLRPEREWSFDIDPSSSRTLVHEAVIATSMDRLV